MLRSIAWSGYPRRVALSIALLGAVVLLGWMLDIDTLKSVLPGFVTMKANTALCLLLAGSALLLRLQAPGWQAPEQGMALIVLLIGLLTLGEYLFDWHIGLDQLVIVDPQLNVNSPYPGRMSIFSATALSASGFALLVLPFNAWRLAVQIAATLVATIGIVSLLGTLWNISLINNSQLIKPAALHTSLAFVALGTALLRASWLGAGHRPHKTQFKTVELKVLLGFIGALLLIVFGGALSYRAHISYAESAGRVAHTQAVRAELDEFFSHLAEMESSQRGFLLTHENSQHEHYLTLNHDVLTQLDTLAEMVSDNPVQAHNLANLRPLVTQRVERLNRILDSYESSGLPAAVHLILSSKSLDLMSQIDAHIHMMEDVEEGRLKQHQQDAEQTRRITLITLLLTLMLAMTVLTILFIAIRREMQARDRIEAYNSTHRDALLLYATHFRRKTVLHGLFELLAEQHHYPVAAFYAFETASNELVCEASHCLSDTATQRFSLGVGLVGEAAQSARTVELSNPNEDMLTIATGLGNFTASIVLAIPVQYREQCLGVLVLATLQTLSVQDRSFIEHVAAQLGVALHNLKQFSDLKYLSEQLHQRSEEINQKNQQLIEINRMKSEFLANMSHELRTPLNAIIGFSEALKDGLVGQMSDNQCQYIDDIYTSGEHLLSLINDILDLAKVEAGKMVLCMEMVNINAVLQNSLSMVRGQAVEHQLQLKLDTDADLPELFADTRKLKQIIYNMLSNAVKFTPDGGSITLSAHHVEDMLELAVTDTGIGISSEDQQRLFQSFVQIDSTLSRQYQGTGLGLVMIKRLTELHGGCVGLDSESGKGSRFWARIPWRRDAEWVI